MNEPKLKKAMNTLEFLSHDEKARMEYESRQKALRDEASWRERLLEMGLEQGIEQGKKQGEKQAIQKTAQNLLQLGLDIETIMQATGLTEQEIHALQQP